jgi:hypothetical protein
MKKFFILNLLGLMFIGNAFAVKDQAFVYIDKKGVKHCIDKINGKNVDNDIKQPFHIDTNGRCIQERVFGGAPEIDKGNFKPANLRAD